MDKMMMGDRGGFADTDELDLEISRITAGGTAQKYERTDDWKPRDLPTR
ncbi:MAG TPA: hypothetical protein VL122_04850 [Nitrospirota bacterium]|nr:hypothetical protein [Nitrospirota bacterium]